MRNLDVHRVVENNMCRENILKYLFIFVYNLILNIQIDRYNCLMGLKPMNSNQESKQKALNYLYRMEIEGCKKCILHKKRLNIVFGCGNADAEIVFVGEAPGFNEDITGVPFSGRSGELLDRIIMSLGSLKNRVYISNVVKCRPPSNRTPLTSEIKQCEIFLKKQLDIIQPKVIICLGACAANCLLNTSEPISKIRGRFRFYKNMLLMPTYHPAYLLRYPLKKRDVWLDIQKVIKVLS